MKNFILHNTPKIILIMMLTVFAFVNPIKANNIQVSNAGVSGQNTASNFSLVNFDVSWDNAWRTTNFESNWDAAYIFVKYRILPMNTWRHATLNYVDGTATNDGNTEPTGATINTTSDGMGAFIYKDANGIGNVNFTGAQLRWNYGADGLTDDDSVEICVQAIEMVYVPQDTFYVGDGSVSLQGQFEDGISGLPLQITSENALTLGGGGVGSLGNNNRSGMVTPIYEDFHNTVSKALPANFPKGYNSFYCMKYEITQGQYADFLNKLNKTQATARYMGLYASINQSITGTYPNYAADAPDRPLEYINYIDFLTYLDWSSLRPMTELEYEKACRGTRNTIADEFAWGDVSIHSTAYTVTNPGLPNETMNTSAGIGNACYSLTHGAPTNRPFRSGAIAASIVSPNRVEAGATYYGIMEMSGNQWELAMTVGRPEGRLFDGSHGNGEITSAGIHNVSNWPTSVWGLGIRGGSYFNASSSARTSSRQYAHYHTTTGARVHQYGGRGVRTAD